jgi:hypothetical protein
VIGSRKLGFWIAAIVGAALIAYCAAIVLANYGFDLIL